MAETTSFTTLEHNTKQTAAALRRALRQQFPHTRFSVTMARGTAHGWLHVTYTDGPTRSAVDDICCGFESSRFDATDDTYHQVEPSLYLIDGEPTLLRYSCCGITLQRHYSPAATAWAARHVIPGTTYYDQQLTAGYPFETDPVHYGSRQLLTSTDLSATDLSEIPDRR